MTGCEQGRLSMSGRLARGRPDPDLGFGFVEGAGGDAEELGRERVTYGGPPDYVPGALAAGYPGKSGGNGAGRLHG
jgi:hypothetical protein